MSVSFRIPFPESLLPFLTTWNNISPPRLNVSLEQAPLCNFNFEKSSQGAYSGKYGISKLLFYIFLQTGRFHHDHGIFNCQINLTEQFL